MGNGLSNQLIIATANYSGITASPFQFYSAQNTKELDQLNDIFKRLFFQIDEGQKNQLFKYTKCYPKQSNHLTYQLDKKFNWGFNTLDKHMHKERYAPHYRQKVGIKYGKFMNKEQFYQMWELQYKNNINYTKIQTKSQSRGKDIGSTKSLDKVDDQKEVCRLFDFLMFQTFVQYSYKQTLEKKEYQQAIIKQKCQIQNAFQDKDESSATKRKKALIYFQEFLQKYFSKQYLSHKHKFAHIKSLYQQCDVVLLQDCHDELINQLKNQGNINIIQPFRENIQNSVLLKDFNDDLINQLKTKGSINIIQPFIENINNKVLLKEFNDELINQLKQQGIINIIQREKKKKKNQQKDFNDELKQLKKQGKMNIIYREDIKNRVLLKDNDDLINQLKTKGNINIIKNIQIVKDRLGAQALNNNYILIKQTSKLNTLYDFNKFINSKQIKQSKLFNPQKFYYNGIVPTICLIDNFLFISIHLSSQIVKRLEQMQSFINHIIQINRQCKGLKIVIGGDFNQNLKEFFMTQISKLKQIKTYSSKEYQAFFNKMEQRINGQSLLNSILKGFYIFPDDINKQDITTRKKRTWLQSQADKSEKQDGKCRDFLITNVQMNSKMIIKDKRISQKQLLPTNSHPFDHFFIKAKISI